MVKSGDIIFVRGRGPLSFINRFFDPGPFSHVALYLGRGTVLDARFFGGVKPRKFDFKDYKVVRVKNVNLFRVAKHIGRKYDLVRWLWYGFKLGKIWGDPNKFICSELVADALEDKELMNKAPNELYRCLIRRGYIVS